MAATTATTRMPERLGRALAAVKAARPGRGKRREPILALAGFEPAIGLVDDVDAALAAHEPVAAVTRAQRTEGVADLHGANGLFKQMSAETAALSIGGGKYGAGRGVSSSGTRLLDEPAVPGHKSAASR